MFNIRLGRCMFKNTCLRKGVNTDRSFMPGELNRQRWKTSLQFIELHQKGVGNFLSTKRKNSLPIFMVFC